MPLSWNEIRQRAITFAREWRDETRERAEAQTFWNEFFQVFGKSRRAIATFEEPVRNLTGDMQFIDLLWPGRVIAEHKSRGANLAKAESQAYRYVRHLIDEGREVDVPRYILVSDFAHVALHDLDADDPAEGTVQFNLADLHEHIREFAFIAGYETTHIDPEDPANIEAAELLANLHDRLEDAGYDGHDLQRFMVRILFCLFAEDTGIFEPEAFKQFITHRTSEDASDLGSQLARLFDVLNTPEDRRQQSLDELLAELPYVNGRLYEERLRFADFTSDMRIALIACCAFKWDTISPAVFGSLFQSIMQPRERRQIGAHYTSERDIMKLIRSLFLDQLRERFERSKNNRREVTNLLREMGEMRFLDPACGCGNFLVIAYRELRRLEMDCLQALYGEQPSEGDLRASARLTVEQFYGIEIEEWPALIAEVAMWLMDHQMNNELFARFGTARPTIPLTESPTIRCANALRIDWNEVLPAGQCSYIMGNPPFVGKHLMTVDQSTDMDAIWNRTVGSGFLDYVTAWYMKSASYAASTTIRIAFVSTNSISQGEQVGILWPALFKRGVKIHFAHRTFAWVSEARGKAHVHVVIIGFGLFDHEPKTIHDYHRSGAEPVVSVASNIGPYLTDGSDRTLSIRSKPICAVPAIVNGNKPADGGFLLIADEDKESFLASNPTIAPYLLPFLSAEQYLQGKRRWTLWLVNVPPGIIRENRGVYERVEKVREFRLASKKASTRRRADRPALFDQIRQPDTDYIVIPRHSSVNRKYIPLGYFGRDTIVGDSCTCVPNATHWEVGVLSSLMHASWMQIVCGRLKSDFRYSNKLVYNNFPWPEPTDAQRAAVERAAQGVLDARKNHPNATLADLYDPLTMPADLAKAHATLDRAVDRCYRPQPFPDERRRFEHLFALYEKLTAPLTTPKKKSRRKKKK